LSDGHENVANIRIEINLGVLKDGDCIGEDSIDPTELLEKLGNHTDEEGHEVDPVGEEGDEGDAAHGLAVLQAQVVIKVKLFVIR